MMDNETYDLLGLGKKVLTETITKLKPHQN